MLLSTRLLKCKSVCLYGTAPLVDSLLIMSFLRLSLHLHLFIWWMSPSNMPDMTVVSHRQSFSGLALLFKWACFLFVLCLKIDKQAISRVCFSDFVFREAYSRYLICVGVLAAHMSLMWSDGDSFLLEVARQHGMGSQQYSLILAKKKNANLEHENDLEVWDYFWRPNSYTVGNVLSVWVAFVAFICVWR